MPCIRKSKRKFSQFVNFDEVVKSKKSHFSVIPAKAGIQSFQGLLDSRLRGSDDLGGFLRVRQFWGGMNPEAEFEQIVTVFRAFIGPLLNHLTELRPSPNLFTQWQRDRGTKAQSRTTLCTSGPFVLLDLFVSIGV